MVIQGGRKNIESVNVRWGKIHLTSVSCRFPYLRLSSLIASSSYTSTHSRENKNVLNGILSTANVTPAFTKVFLQVSYFVHRAVFLFEPCSFFLCLFWPFPQSCVRTKPFFNLRRPHWRPLEKAKLESGLKLSDRAIVVNLGRTQGPPRWLGPKKVEFFSSAPSTWVSQIFKIFGLIVFCALLNERKLVRPCLGIFRVIFYVGQAFKAQ